MKAAIVGATGIVGQQFIVALSGHPYIEISALAGSTRSAGQKYGDAVRTPAGASQWFCEEPCDKSVKDMTVQLSTDLRAEDYDVIFTGLEADTARELEPLYAKTTPVISTASAFRYEPDVPLLVPGVNPEHAKLLDIQRKNRGWKGYITPNPNCTTIGLAITLKPLHDAFGVRTVLMTSMQALSGAGRSGGVLGMDILDNVVPYIPKEEQKVQRETQKILGSLNAEGIEDAPFAVSCTCTRVNVQDGHTESVFVALDKPASVDDVKAAIEAFNKAVRTDLPSAPQNMITVTEDPFHPQPKWDRMTEGGMSTVVGRIREDHALPNGVKYVLLSHNTKMGAAKGCVLTAEMLAREGYIKR
ncbi:MAG: aspartate-semialdehyde dehydrogenase [Armatimonadetes bacterium]|nr:aspartate-semialdehyde dehydrogenase [Armatimonadota bacterium]